MSKMGQELERKLDEAKYDLWEALQGMIDYAGHGNINSDMSSQAQRNRIILALKALAKVG